MESQSRVGAFLCPPTVPVTIGGNSTTIGIKRKYWICDFADVRTDNAAGKDEVSRCLLLNMRTLLCAKDKAMEDPYFAARFWFERKTTYPGLYALALRVFANPVSFCASERVFSTLNKIITKDRTHLSPDTLLNIIIARSLSASDF